MAGGEGASKAQAALARIIAVILTVPPCHASAIDVDLSLRLGGAGLGDGNACSAVVDPPVAGDQGLSDKDPTAEPEEEAGGEKSSEGECEKAISGITNLDAQREEEVEEKGRGEGYLELLLEAARQVGGGGLSDGEGESGKGRRPEASPPPPLAAEGREGGGAGRSRRKRATEWTAPLGLYELEEEEAAAPVVRSKRGRSQALPSRFRDSVLEPWRKPPTVYRNGGRTTMAGR